MFKIRFLCFHSSSIYYSSNKNLLSKLRKTTGFSFINCKEALNKLDNDIKKAEEYLKERAQKEGWTKATKLQGRPMSQGLIGIILQNNAASIVEVNCETDFVSRNLKFKNFTTLICSALHFHGLGFSKSKINYNKDEMAELEMNGKKLSDLTALEMGLLGENISIRRGIFIKSLPTQHISYYIHEIGPKIDSSLSLCYFGKYGALVVYSRDEKPDVTDEDVKILPTEQIGRELCQHIVGMNPLCIDRNDPQPDIEIINSEDNKIASKPKKDFLATSNIENVTNHDGESTACEAYEGTRQKVNETKKIADEVRLLRQEFILNTDITVRQYLQQQGVHVIDFIRLECGEDLAEEAKELQQAAAV